MFGRDPVVDDQHRHTGGLRVRAHQAVVNREQRREETAAVQVKDRTSGLLGRRVPIPRQPQLGAIGRLRDNVSAIDTRHRLTGIRQRGHCIGEVLTAALDISDSWPGFSGEGRSTQTGENLRIHMQGHGESLDPTHKFPIFLTFTAVISKYLLMALCLAGEQAFRDSGSGGIPSTALRSAQWRPATGSETADG